MKALTLLLIPGCLAVLGACTTPGQSQMNCQPRDCHFYGPATPYERHPDSRYTNADSSPSVTAAVQTSAQAMLTASADPIFSVGDRIAVQVLNGSEFSDELEINADGFIYLNFLPPIAGAGRHLRQIEADVAAALVSEKLMHASAVHVSVRPLSWAPIEVLVSGAVFEPGQHMINDRPESIDPAVAQVGDLGQNRTIAAALRASGGIRPDANPAAIELIRNNQLIRLDLSGTLSGEKVPGWLLQAGDRIHVPSSPRFDESLVRPSQITVPGIRVFISNLTQPASSNSQSAVDTEATRFPYGTRLLAGAIAANCVGGAQTSNASRQVLLVTKNPLTAQTEVVERSLDALIGNAWRPEMNPVLLPGDGIACYDSSVTNLRELARTFSDILLPLTLAGLL